MNPWRLLRALLQRFSAVFKGSQSQQSFADEIESHLQLHIEDNLRLGMTPEQARREAILKLGGVEMTKQSYRERNTLPLLDDLLQDLRFALRQLRRSPAFTITAALMLSLGIGASVAIFAFVDAALLKPLPYRDPTRLAGVNEAVKLFGRAPLSYPDYLDWKRLNNVFSSMDVFTGTGFMLNTSSGAEPVEAARVSDGFFRTLGTTPVLGRDFYQGEDLPSAQSTMILNYATWKLRFAGRMDIVGQVVQLSGEPYTIVGVLPEDFHFALDGGAEFWVPFHAKGECDLRRSCHSLHGIGRLKDGVTIQAAQSEMQSIASQLERQYPGDNRGQGATIELLSELIVCWPAVGDSLRQRDESAPGGLRKPQQRDRSSRRPWSFARANRPPIPDRRSDACHARMRSRSRARGSRNAPACLTHPKTLLRRHAVLPRPGAWLACDCIYGRNRGNGRRFVCRHTVAAPATDCVAFWSS